MNGRKHLLECSKQALIVISTFLPPLMVYLGLKEKNRTELRKQALSGIILLLQYTMPTLVYFCTCGHVSQEGGREGEEKRVRVACVPVTVHS